MCRLSENGFPVLSFFFFFFSTFESGPSSCVWAALKEMRVNLHSV